MRQQEDGDIKPTKKDMKEADNLFKDLLDLVGEHSEYAQDFKSGREDMKKGINDATS